MVNYNYKLDARAKTNTVNYSILSAIYTAEKRYNQSCIQLPPIRYLPHLAPPFLNVGIGRLVSDC